jgi:transcriptional regulator with XRE-family HTH domain
MDAIELRARRLALGLTQPALADHLGNGQSTISAWEQGKYPIPPGLEDDLAALEAAQGDLIRRMSESDAAAVIIDDWADTGLPDAMVLVAAAIAAGGRPIQTTRSLRTDVHPAFLRRARKALNAHGGEQVPAEQLALWAQNARMDRRLKAVALVAEDGSIVGEAKRYDGSATTPGATYATPDTIDRYDLTMGSELAITVGTIRRTIGQKVVAIRFSETAQGLDSPISDWAEEPPY